MVQQAPLPSPRQSMMMRRALNSLLWALAAVVAVQAVQIASTERTMERRPRSIWAHVTHPRKRWRRENERAARAGAAARFDADTVALALKPRSGSVASSLAAPPPLRSYWAFLWSGDPEHLWIILRLPPLPDDTDAGKRRTPGAALLRAAQLRRSTSALMLDLASGAVDVLVFDGRIRRVQPVPAPGRDWIDHVPRRAAVPPPSAFGAGGGLARYFAHPAEASEERERMDDAASGTGTVLLCVRNLADRNYDAPNSVATLLPVELDARDGFPRTPPRTRAPEEEGGGTAAAAEPSPQLAHVVAYSSVATDGG